MRRIMALRWAAFVALLLVTGVTFHWNSTLYRGVNEDLRRKLLSLAEAPSSTTPTTTVERTNIFLLKAHKCASSTMQNILLRFGFARELDFVLPSVNNYIGSPTPFNANMITADLTSKSGKYNIFTHHTRYNSEQMKAVMHEDAAFVTILREPADVFESIFSYYKFNKTFNLTLNELLETPTKVSKINHRFLNRIGLNQMSFDLGMAVEDLNTEESIQAFVNKIDNEFDLVMISEYMEASLVLLCDLMHWPLENVVSLKLNSRPESAKYKLTDKEREVLHDLNHIDDVLYKHFLKKFFQQVVNYGEDKMRNDILKLLNLNEKLSFRCVESLNMKGFGHTTAYQLRNTDDWLCYYAARPELAFTDEVRTYQIKKFAVLNKLDKFVNRNTDNNR